MDILKKPPRPVEIVPTQVVLDALQNNSYISLAGSYVNIDVYNIDTCRYM